MANHAANGRGRSGSARAAREPREAGGAPRRVQRMRQSRSGQPRSRQSGNAPSALAMAGDATASTAAATAAAASAATSSATAAASTAARKIAALTDVGPFGGFKKFISRGSMIDMAVGVVMGSAVTGVVNAIVANLINPLIAAIGGQPDMSGILNVTLPHNAVISFGSILNAILNFLLIGVAVYFCVILPINKLRDMTASVLDEEDAAESASSAAAEAAEAEASERTLAVLEEIRDELKRVNARTS